MNSFANEVDENDEFVEDVNDADVILEGDFAFPTADGPEYIQGSPEFIQRGPEYIFGSRDFEKMRNLPPNSQDYILGRKVGWITIPVRNNPNRVWICTGFLVGPDLFMTNHHCIHDDVGRLPLGNARIYMDYYQEPSVDRTRGGVTAGVSGVLRADAPKDYALLRLDRPIGNTYGWLELDTTTRANTGQNVKIIHHSDGRSKEISRRNSQIVDVPADFLAQHPELRYVVAYLADTEGGASGSPVFLRDGTGVIAIHHSGWFRRIGGRVVPQFNAGTLMSYIVPEIRQWLPSGTPPTPPPTPAGNLMYWTDVGRNKIQRATLNGTNVQDLVIGVKADGIALDVEGGKMYWTNDLGAAKIQRANLDGSNVQNLVTRGLTNLADIELDIAGGKMYWTDFGGGKIQRANLDGSNIQNLITGLRSPNGIALDVASGKMYWTDNNAETIQRANLDGTNVQDLVTRGLSGPIGIALDLRNEKIYWVDTGADTIQRANLDGTNVQDLVTGLRSSTLHNVRCSQRQDVLDRVLQRQNPTCESRWHKHPRHNHTWIGASKRYHPRYFTVHYADPLQSGFHCGSDLPSQYAYHTPAVASRNRRQGTPHLHAFADTRRLST